MKITISKRNSLGVLWEVKSVNINPKNNLVAIEVSDTLEAAKIYNILCNNDYYPVMIGCIIAVQVNGINIQE